VVFPFDPTRDDPAWLSFNQRFEKRFGARPDAFASLAYDTMNILLESVCKAGLNRGKIRDALTGTQHYKGVTGEMTFDPNCKNVVPMFLGTVHGGKVKYQRYGMEPPYARTDAAPAYNGPATGDAPAGPLRIGVFGPHADDAIARLSPSLARFHGRYALVGISSDVPWGKASTELVKTIYDDHALALIATDRNSSHLAEQLAVKMFVPVVAVSDDKALTTVNIPWLFRLPSDTSVEKALSTVLEAAERSGPNRGRLREALAATR